MKFTIPVQSSDGTWGKKTLDAQDSFEEMQNEIRKLQAANARLMEMLEQKQAQDDDRSGGEEE